MDFKEISEKAQAEKERKDKIAAAVKLINSAKTSPEQLKAYTAWKVAQGYDAPADNASKEELDTFFRDCKAYQGVQVKLAAHQLKDMLAGEAKESRHISAARKVVRRNLGLTD